MKKSIMISFVIVILALSSCGSNTVSSKDSNLKDGLYKIVGCGVDRVSNAYTTQDAQCFAVINYRGEIINIDITNVSIDDNVNNLNEGYVQMENGRIVNIVNK